MKNPNLKTKPLPFSHNLPDWMLTEDMHHFYILPLTETIKNLESGINYWLTMGQYHLDLRNNEEAVKAIARTKGMEKRLSRYKAIAKSSGITLEVQ